MEKSSWPKSTENLKRHIKIAKDKSPPDSSSPHSTHSETSWYYVSQTVGCCQELQRCWHHCWLFSQARCLSSTVGLLWLTVVGILGHIHQTWLLDHHKFYLHKVHKLYVLVSQHTCYATMPHEEVPMNTKGVDIQLYLLGSHSHVPVAVSANWHGGEAASLWLLLLHLKHGCQGQLFQQLFWLPSTYKFSSRPPAKTKLKAPDRTSVKMFHDQAKVWTCKTPCIGGWANVHLSGV